MLKSPKGIEPWSWKPWPLLHEIACQKKNNKKKWNIISMEFKLCTKHTLHTSQSSYQPNQQNWMKWNKYCKYHNKSTWTTYYIKG
jgi:hypothetical protein